MRRTAAAALIAVGLVVANTTFASPLAAASPPGGWPTWTITPEDPLAQNHSGTIAFGVTGMPDATYTVSKNIPDGDGQDVKLKTNEEEYIGSGTPFGAIFGPSGPSADTQFLSTRIAGIIDSVATVTVTFNEATPAGLLGFAVSDVDVDQVVVTGTTAGGAPLSGAELAGEAFNLCDTPDAPEICDGVTPPFVLPTWDPATGTVTGSGDDTDGEAVWFRPTVAVTSLTFVYAGPDSIPSFRLWLAALQATVSGTVASTCAAATQPIQLTLTDPAGNVIETVATAADGTYAFAPVLAVDSYAVGVGVPPGCTLGESNPTTVALAGGDATVNFTLTGEAPPTPATPRYTG